jgi:hypothetical protein
MKWTHISVSFPAGPNFEVGLLIFSVVMLSVNIGLIVAMRYERRVR